MENLQGCDWRPGGPLGAPGLLWYRGPRGRGRLGPWWGSGVGGPGAGRGVPAGQAAVGGSGAVERELASLA